MKDNTSSKLLAIAGALMTLSGLLMALCGRIAIGGCFLVSAACMFAAGYLFRLAKKKKNEEEKKDE